MGASLVSKMDLRSVEFTNIEQDGNLAYIIESTCLQLIVWIG